MGDGSGGSVRSGVWVMRWKAFALLAAVAGLAIGAVTAATEEASAQTTVRNKAAPATDASAQRRRPPRVVIYPIYPYRTMYRQCVDGYVVEQRVATGPTVVPRIRCWWVRG
jgi:hypothetical protein